MTAQNKLSDELAADLGATVQTFLLSNPDIARDMVARAFANAMQDAEVYWHDAQREGVDA